MRKYVFKRVFSIAMALALVLSMSSVAFAATDSDTATRNGKQLVGDVLYYSKDSDFDSGETHVNATWSGSNVQKMYATVEVVNYLTGATLLSDSESSSNTTSVWVSENVGISNSTKVTVFGCGEIRDSFSLAVYPTIYGTYGND